MKKFKRLFWIAVILFMIVWPVSSVRSQTIGTEEDILVGRITYVSGKILRFVSEEKDWVVTVKDAPFGLNDTLYSEREGKAEFIMPNNMMMRISGDTQVQLIALNPEVTEVDVASGMARLYNKSSRSVVKASTPFGYVFAGAGTVFDLYIGDESLEVIAVKGTVDFVSNSDQASYEVDEGEESILADRTGVASGDENVDADWDDWNAERDILWAKRARLKGESARHLPPALEDAAYELEENGRWENVYYEGGYHEFWRPIYVGSEWRPYTVGRWTVYYGDNCWIPEEPFGYITHHYGSWVYVNNFWYWAPPVVSVGTRVGPSAIGLGWYPGRVGWIYSGVELGWFPLLWSEPYYSHHRWGHHSTVINNINIKKINNKVDRYAYARHAVVLNTDRIYGYNNYRGHIRRLDQRTIRNFQAAPVVDNRIINNFDRNPNRFRQTNVVANVKPNRAVINRIERNQNVARQAGNIDSKAIQQDIQRVRHARPARGTRTEVQHPRDTDRFVNSSDRGKPAPEVKPDRSEFKTRPQSAQELPATRTQTQPDIKTKLEVRPLVPGQIFPPSDRVRRATPTAKPGQEIQIVTPGQVPQPSERGRRAAPSRPERGFQTGEPSQVKQPIPKPIQEAQPAAPTQIRQPSEHGRRAAPTEHSQKLRSVEPGQTGSSGSNRQLRRTPQEMAPQKSLEQPTGDGHQLRDRGRQVPEQHMLRQPIKTDGSSQTTPGNQMKQPKQQESQQQIQQQAQQQQSQQEIPQARQQIPEQRTQQRVKELPMQQLPLQRRRVFSQEGQQQQGDKRRGEVTPGQEQAK